MPRHLPPIIIVVWAVNTGFLVVNVANQAHPGIILVNACGVLFSAAALLVLSRK